MNKVNLDNVHANLDYYMYLKHKNTFDTSAGSLIQLTQKMNKKRYKGDVMRGLYEEV